MASKNGKSPNGKRALKHYRPQVRNANKHTPMGLKGLGNSIGRDGIIDGITVAANREAFSGSARLETLADLMPGVKIVEVDTDGNTLIVNRRTDIPTADDQRAKRLGFAANSIPNVNYNPDGEVDALLAAEDAAIAEMVKADERATEAVVLAAAEVGKELLGESSENLKPKNMFHVLMSIHIDNALDIKSLIEQCESLGAEVLYGSN